MLKTCCVNFLELIGLKSFNNTLNYVFVHARENPYLKFGAVCHDCVIKFESEKRFVSTKLIFKFPSQILHFYGKIT